MLEHGAYTLLLDSCYDRECFPTLDDAIEWTWARSDEEIAAVKFVLSKFFVLEDGVYKQNRIYEEIEKYHSNSETNKRIAIEREEKRRTKRTRTVNEPPPNQEPLTKNQEPIISSPKGSRYSADSILSAQWGNVALEIRDDWNNEDVQVEFEAFRDYWIAKPGKDGIKLDWLATWRNWCRNSKRKGNYA